MQTKEQTGVYIRGHIKIHDPVSGEVLINKAKIVTRNGLGQDITAQIIAIQIFEDIFSPFIIFER